MNRTGIRHATPDPFRMIDLAYAEATKNERAAVRARDFASATRWHRERWRWLGEELALIEKGLTSP